MLLLRVPPQVQDLAGRVASSVPDPQNVSTSYVERQNLSVRMECRRFTRLRNGFSKKLENHSAAIALWIGFYNFCRVHESLRRTRLMPPRNSKSYFGSERYPAWYLGRHPERSVIAVSYSQELASDFGRRVRNLVSDPVHRSIFPECVISDDSAAVHRFGLTAGGNYYAVGVGGPITGRGADLLLLDDPIKGYEQAHSAAERKKLKEWYSSVAYTRLQGNASIVVLQTCWHSDDLVGWQLREHPEEGWTILRLPALAEPNDPLGRPEGAALWPERFPVATLERIREAIGSSAWASLYQQRPVAEEGAIFKREHFRAWSTQPECRRIVFSLDTALKVAQTSDYSVVQVWGETTNGYALLHLLRERLEFPELVRRAQSLAAFWHPHLVLIEDAASGQSLIQSLKSETRLPVLPVKPQGDKVSRANAVSPLVESGRVLLPEVAPWLANFLDEVTAFPAAPHDDLVDAMTQALNWMRGQTGHVDHNFLYTAQTYFHNLELARIGQQPRGGSMAEQDAAEDRANDMQRSSNPLRLVKSRR